MIKRILPNLRRDRSGATAIEMAILAPLVITMMLGVLQLGFYMQAQNALRGVTADMGRYMAVESAKNNFLTNDQIRNAAISTASNPPYLLQQGKLDVTVANEATQSMNKVRKVDLTVSYDVPNILGFADLDVLTLDYTQSVFLPGPEITPSPSPSAT